MQRNKTNDMTCRATLQSVKLKMVIMRSFPHPGPIPLAAGPDRAVHPGGRDLGQARVTAGGPHAPSTARLRPLMDP